MQNHYRIIIQRDKNYPEIHAGKLELYNSEESKVLFSAPCVLGAGGISDNKKEGDKSTPAGCWPIRKLFYRSDRIITPQTRIPTQKIKRYDGWCDQTSSKYYNTLIDLNNIDEPAIEYEKLYRSDNLYNLIMTIGYNDDPPVPGAGSAIFMHICPPANKPTLGCIALEFGQLSKLIQYLKKGDLVVVKN